MISFRRSLTDYAIVVVTGLLLSVQLISGQAYAGNAESPVGLWKTFDDKTGQASGLVRIYEQDNKLYGRIEKTLTPGDETLMCTSCRDERRDQRIVGMVIMRSVAFENGRSHGGDFLDPDNGNIYRCDLKIEDQGAKLRVRGYIGISLVGRSQIWERVDQQE